VFAKHHYLSHSFNKSAEAFLLYANGELAGFTSAIHFVHPYVKNTKQEHRTVVLPDFQGIGLGVYLRNFIAEYYKKNGFSFITTTSNPALVHAMKKDKNWNCTRFGRTSQLGKSSGKTGLKGSISGGSRVTTSWKYVG